MDSHGCHRLFLLFNKLAAFQGTDVEWEGGAASRDSNWFSVPEIVTVLEPSDTKAPGGTAAASVPRSMRLVQFGGEGTSLCSLRVAADTFDWNSVAFFYVATPCRWLWGHRCRVLDLPPAGVRLGAATSLGALHSRRGAVWGPPAASPGVRTPLSSGRVSSAASVSAASAGDSLAEGLVT